MTVAALLVVAGCRADRPAAVTPPRLPPGDAGRVLARAIEAAGGWDRWQSRRDVTYVSMLTIVDPSREVTSDSIGWFAAPLHDGARARMDSIGLPNEVRFGIDAAETWIVSDGEPITAPGQLALTRFDLVSSLFWFSLPFGLVELPATLTYAGGENSPDGARWEKLRVEFDQPHPGVPGKWFVLYIDQESGLIDHVHAKLSAPFLRHELWVGQWLHYRDWDGIKKERQRKFFPANDAGDIVGALVAEQFVEHVRFNNGLTPHYFRKPAEVPPPAAPPPGNGHGWSPVALPPSEEGGRGGIFQSRIAW
ncbi:MAG: hypothetical protein SF182_23375 [Deltaproteobacteria bacterium]|nr:hypothetical protein [Deltaproteobacteria bacterium]